jgi:hypothetical protein
MEMGSMGWIEDFLKVRRKAIPYTIRLANTDVPQPLLSYILFGANRYSDDTNYGSRAGVTQTVAGGGATYRELLAQSQTKPFKVKYWFISTSNVNNFLQSIVFNWEDADGVKYSEAVSLFQYIDMYQISTTSVAFKFPATIDGKFWISSAFITDTTVSITIYPDIIADPTNLLNEHDEGDLVEQFDEPVISEFLKAVKRMEGRTDDNV